jgi:hypothetical protein
VHVSGTRSRSGYSVLSVTKIQWPTAGGRALGCCKGHAKITRSRTTPWSCQWTYYYLFLSPLTNHHPLQHRVTLCRNCNSILSVASSRVVVKLFSTVWVFPLKKITFNRRPLWKRLAGWLIQKTCLLRWLNLPESPTLTTRWALPFLTMRPTRCRCPSFWAPWSACWARSCWRPVRWRCASTQA